MSRRKVFCRDYIKYTLQNISYQSIMKHTIPRLSYQSLMTHTIPRLSYQSLMKHTIPRLSYQSRSREVHLPDKRRQSRTLCHSKRSRSTQDGTAFQRRSNNPAHKNELITINSSLRKHCNEKLQNLVICLLHENHSCMIHDIFALPFKAIYEQ